MNKDRLSFLVTMIATFSLTTILMSMVGVMLYGLFDMRIDNTEVFKTISPAFQTIVGGFIGLITGIKIGSGDKSE